MEKKCATCAHCSPCEWGCSSEVSGFNFIVDADDLWCGGKGYEERADTLDKVARDMLLVIGVMVRNSDTFRDDAERNFRERLEALGVDV